MAFDRRRGRSVRRRAILLLLGVAAACGLLPPGGVEIEVAHWAGLTCRRLEVAAGPEDLVVDQTAGVAYVAATDRRALAGDAEVPPDGRIGRLLRVDLERDPPILEDVTPAALRIPRFHPQGLDLWVGEDGRAERLLVTDRRHGYDPETRSFDTCSIDNAVHILRIAGDGTLVPERTVADPDALVRLNDVAATSRSTFYATNDHAARTCFERNLRDLFGRNGGHLVRYDGSRFATVAADLPFANGVAFDRARGRIHVAASQAGEIVTLTPEDGGFTRQTRLVGSAPDNLTLLPDGRLLVAAHPDRFAFLRYRLGWAATAPSQVLALDPTGEGPVREVFADDGSLFPAASVAALYTPPRGPHQLILGTVYDSAILICRGAP